MEVQIREKVGVVCYGLWFTVIRFLSEILYGSDGGSIEPCSILAMVAFTINTHCTIQSVVKVSVSYCSIS